MSHGTAQLPSSQRYYLTAKGIREVAAVLGFGTPSDFVRAYPVAREGLALLIRRMDAVSAVCRLAASLSPASTAFVPTWSFTGGVELARGADRIRKFLEVADHHYVGFGLEVRPQPTALEIVLVHDYRVSR